MATWQRITLAVLLLLVVLSVPAFALGNIKWMTCNKFAGCIKHDSLGRPLTFSNGWYRRVPFGWSLRGSPAGPGWFRAHYNSSSLSVYYHSSDLVAR